MKKVLLTVMTLLLVAISGYAQVEILLDEPFTESLGEFTLDEQKYPGCTYASMWYVDKTHKYAKVTANKSGQSLGASDCKLISPVLNTQGCTHVYLRFEHTTYAANSTSDVDYCMVKVSKDGKTWTKVTIPTWPTKRWGFVTCEMDLTEYASNTMQVMFEYVSTASYAGTWEVKNVVVEGWWPGEPNVPDCPYEALEGLTSKELRESLHEEIKDHTVLTYKQIRGDQAEVDVHENGKIWDMYSAYEFNLSDYCHDIDVIAGECYNREHILPKSWWGYSEANEANDPMYTDLHHVISTDAVANDTRSNYIYDEVKNATWTNNLGSKLGTSMNWYNQTAFEPVDEYKGDIARVYFYMLTCYMDQNFAVNAKGKKYFSYTNGVCEFQPQALALMLKWHRQDPVSEKEVVRNAKVADLQGNVNPFVVEPDLVEYIWGTMKGKAYDCDAEVETPDPGTVDGAITCQEARELALALADNTQSVEDYVVVGYVSALDVDYSTQYGNQSFWVADELNGGQVFYAYRCYNESPVNLGDKVSLTGKLLNYYGTPEMKLGQTNVLESASTSGVEDVEVLDWRDADVEIYSVTGQKMSGMREELPQGVYVLRRGDRVSRVVVR
jgi:endonuclease I